MNDREANADGIIASRSTVDSSRLYHVTIHIPLSGGVSCRLRGLRSSPARRFELFLRDGEQGLEGFVIPHGKVGERLAIERDAAFLQTVDEPRVGQALAPGRSVDPGDPERAKITLADAPVP